MIYLGIYKKSFQERVIIDQPKHRPDGYRWCHLVAKDVDILHNVARIIGLKPEWFQDKTGKPHYDIKGQIMRNRAIRLGAKEVTSQYMVEYLQYHYKDKKNAISSK